MKVLLHADIEQLGYFGDIVEVSDGYARNCLLPGNLAILPTAGNLKAIQKEKARQAEKRRLALEQLKKVAQNVQGAQVTLRVLANEQGHLFGSVAEADIAKALQEQGHEVQTRQVQLPEHIRQLGRYEVTLRFGPEVQAQIEVRVILPTDGEEDGETPESEIPGESDASSESGS